MFASLKVRLKIVRVVLEKSDFYNSVGRMTPMNIKLPNILCLPALVAHSPSKLDCSAEFQRRNKVTTIVTQTRETEQTSQFLSNAYLHLI